jgi:hypothetical protein
MVKVLLLKQVFDGQQIVGLDEEPLEITATDGDNFIVATKEGNATSIDTTLILVLGVIHIYSRNEALGSYIIENKFRTANSSILALQYVKATKWYRIIKI